MKPTGDRYIKYFKLVFFVIVVGLMSSKICGRRKNWSMVLGRFTSI